MDIINDCIEKILLIANMKFTMAQLNKYWAKQANKHVQNISAAINNSDYFSISRNYNWRDHISGEYIFRLGNPVLARAYISNIPIINHQKILYGAGISGNLDTIKIAISVKNYCTTTCMKYLQDRIPWEFVLTGAVHKNHTDIISKLLNSKKYFNAVIEYKWDTVLYIGYKYNNCDVVEYALNQGGYISPNDMLACVCFSGNIDLINLAIELGAVNWDNAITCICEIGNVELLKILLDPNDTKLINKPNNILYHWDVLLYYACLNNRSNMIDFIISQKPSNYNKGLIAAYYSGNIALIYKLTNLGAKFTYNCITQIYTNGNIDSIKQLIQIIPNNIDTDKFIKFITYGIVYNFDFSICKYILGNYPAIGKEIIYNIRYLLCTIENPGVCNFIKDPQALISAFKDQIELDLIRMNSDICICGKLVKDH